MKRHHLFGAALGTAALAFSGTVLAAATGFNQYTVDSNANISLGSGCDTANGCVVLINEPGMLQARRQDTTGNQFFQTINTDDPVDLVVGSTNSLPAEFRNEAFVGVGSTNAGPGGVNNNDGSYSVAALNYVDTGSETDGTLGNSFVDTLIHHGNIPDFIASSGPQLEINQQSINGAGTQTVTGNFHFESAVLTNGDPFDTTSNPGGASMRIDQTGPTNGQGAGGNDTFTLRKASGAYVTTSGTANPAGTPIAFSAGDYIQAVWMTSPVNNTNGSAGTFEFGSFDNFTTATSDGTANDNTAADASGITQVDWTAAGPGWWDGSAGMTADLGATTDAFPTDSNLVTP